MVKGYAGPLKHIEWAFPFFIRPPPVEDIGIPAGNFEKKARNSRWNSLPQPWKSSWNFEKWRKLWISSWNSYFPQFHWNSSWNFKISSRISSRNFMKISKFPRKIFSRPHVFYRGGTDKKWKSPLHPSTDPPLYS